MRFVKGDSLKEAIERFHANGSVAEDPGHRTLELRKLLRRFIDVCNAIDYAHSRGVLHRDIKPGNIIVGEHGETLVVDWGLAKPTGKSDADSRERALSPSSSSGSAETLPGSALGTPAYMSPEQAGGDLEALGPRSDVYNLGATLYCLLTGHAPFTGASGEVLRAVQQGGFRLPRIIDRAIDPALEAVCLKAMALRPEDRYASCRALVEDIERWMADEPVSAWREPVSRRARRWMQRRRTAMAAAAVALVAAVVGLGTVTAVQAQANRALSKANGATKDAAQRADDNAGLINGALGRLVQRVGGDASLRAAGLTSFRDEILRDAVAMYDELDKRNPGKATLGLAEALNNQALVRYLLGEFPRGIASELRAEAVLLTLEPSYQARLALANARKQLGVIYHSNGKSAEGLEKTREAVALYQPLVRERPSDQDARFQLALATVNLGNYAMQSDPRAAMEHYREALALFAPLRRESSTNSRYAEWEARTMSNVGLILVATGKIEDGVATQRQAVALAEQVGDEFIRLDTLGMCRNNLAEALEQAKRPAEAETFFRQSLQDYRTLAGRFPKDVDYPWGVAMTLASLADVVLQLNRPREARDLIEGSGKLFDDLTKSLGNNAEFQEHRRKQALIRDAIRQRLDSRSR
jgi:serine/threonine-protein kinase